MDNCKSCGARYEGLSNCSYCGRMFFVSPRKIHYIDTSLLSKEDIKHLIFSYKNELLTMPHQKMRSISEMTWSK